MKSLLFDYLKEVSKYHPEIYDNLKMDINNKIYFHGKNFKYSPENRKNRYKFGFITIIWAPWKVVKLAALTMYSIIKSYIYKSNTTQKNTNTWMGKLLILSNIAFLDNKLREIWREVCTLNSWTSIQDIKISLATLNIRRKILYWSFKTLISKRFIDEVIEYKQLLKEHYRKSDIKALFISNNVTFLESIFIDIFDELGKPSFEIVHWYPSIYRNFPKKANYTLVRSEKMKENFIKIAWMKSEKILVAGNPRYPKPSKKELRFGLDNILVLHKDNTGRWSKIYYDNLDVITSDIGNSIGYLYSIENVLKKCGVKSARLRIHPGEDINRYRKYINTDFYVFDNEPLSVSLEKASLTIWPWSTVFLEAIYYGVNYLFYEPRENNLNIMNFPLVPPFDGSDIKAPVAIDEESLYTMIKNKKMINKTILNDYIKTPFDLSFLKEIIK